MSEQALNLKDDWQQIKEEFREHFKSINLNFKDEVIEYSSGGEHLRIHKNGNISGVMPLHENEIKNAEQININQSEIKIISRDSNYIFRR